MNKLRRMLSMMLLVSMLLSLTVPVQALAEEPEAAAPTDTAAVEQPAELSEETQPGAASEPETEPQPSEPIEESETASQPSEDDEASESALASGSASDETEPMELSADTAAAEPAAEQPEETPAPIEAEQPEETPAEPEAEDAEFDNRYSSVKVPGGAELSFKPVKIKSEQLTLPEAEGGALTVLEAWSFVGSEAALVRLTLTGTPELEEGEELILAGLSHSWKNQRESDPVDPADGCAGEDLLFAVNPSLYRENVRPGYWAEIDSSEITGYAVLRFTPDEAEQTDEAEAEQTDEPDEALAEQTITAQILDAAAPQHSPAKAPAKSAATIQPARGAAEAQAAVTAPESDGAAQTVTEAVILSGLLPVGATVEATPVQVTLPDFETIIAYDIKIYDKNGDEWQPEESVRVEIDNAALSGLSDSLKVFHLADASAQAELVASVHAVDGAVSFSAESFSLYAVAKAVLEKTLTTPDGNTYQVTVTYDSASGIPTEGTRLEVSELTGEDYDSYLDQTEEIIGSVDDARVFDIKIVDEATGEEYQPAPGAAVDVSIRLVSSDARISGGQVVHFGGGEVLETRVEPVEGGCSYSFETDSFSAFVAAYTVDFWYNGYGFSIFGEAEILLSELLVRLGVTGFQSTDVVNVTFTNPELIRVEKVDGDWNLISLKPFNTDEMLTLKLADGQTVEIRVTDAGVCRVGSTYYNSIEDAVKGNTGTFTIEMLTDVSISKSIVLYASTGTAANNRIDAKNKTITITTASEYSGSGSKAILSRASGFTAQLFNVNESTATLKFENIIIDGSGVSVATNGTLMQASAGNLILNNGAILQNGITTNNGGAVYVNGGTFTMNDGSVIQNCKATGDGSMGGGVHVASGSFVMNGGTIQYCEAYRNHYFAGGGVCLYGGNFTMNGGTIKNCRAAATAGNGWYGGFGGGLAINHNQAAYMNGGLITGCTATKGGSAIECHEDLYMTGGTITGNNGGKANGQAGAINFYNNGSRLFVHGSPKIYDNFDEDGNYNDVAVRNAAGNITVDGDLKSDAIIGVNKEGTFREEDQFGVYTTTNVPKNLNIFYADLNDSLIGMGVTNGKKLVWSIGIRMNAVMYVSDTAKAVDIANSSGSYAPDYGSSTSVTKPIADVASEYAAHRQYLNDMPYLYEFKFGFAGDDKDSIAKISSSYAVNGTRRTYTNKYNTSRSSSYKDLPLNTVVTLYYQLKPSITISVLSKDDDSVIMGTAFELYAGTTKIWSGSAYADGKVTIPWTETESADGGGATFEAGSSYKLVQTATGDSYVLPGGSWTISVNSDFEISAETTPSPAETNRTWDMDGENAAFTVYNDSEPIVTYDANGGTFTGTTPETVDFDNTETSHTYRVSSITPTMDGKAFGGWKDANGDVYSANDPIVFYRHEENDNITLTAQWVEGVSLKLHVQELETNGTLTDKDSEWLTDGQAVTLSVANDVTLDAMLETVKACIKDDASFKIYNVNYSVKANMTHFYAYAKSGSTVMDITEKLVFDSDNAKLKIDGSSEMNPNEVWFVFTKGIPVKAVYTDTGTTWTEIAKSRGTYWQDYYVNNVVNASLTLTADGGLPQFVKDYQYPRYTNYQDTYEKDGSKYRFGYAILNDSASSIISGIQKVTLTNNTFKWQYQLAGSSTWQDLGDNYITLRYNPYPVQVPVYWVFEKVVDGNTVLEKIQSSDLYYYSGGTLNPPAIVELKEETYIVSRAQTGSRIWTPDYLAIHNYSETKPDGYPFQVYENGAVKTGFWSKYKFSYYATGARAFEDHDVLTHFDDANAMYLKVDPAGVMFSNNAGFDNTQPGNKVETSFDAGLYIVYTADPVVTGHSLTVTKQVTGEMGDTGQSFTITVSSDALTAGETYNGYTVDVEKRITLTLKHGESITLQELPEGTYTVTETDAAGYSATYQYQIGASGELTTGQTFTLSDDATVTITNKRGPIAPTGYDGNADAFKPLLLFGAFFAVLPILGGLKRRRKRADADEPGPDSPGEAQTLGLSPGGSPETRAAAPPGVLSPSASAAARREPPGFAAEIRRLAREKILSRVILTRIRGWPRARGDPKGIPRAGNGPLPAGG